MIHKTSGKLQIVLVAVASYSFRRPKLEQRDPKACRSGCTQLQVQPQECDTYLQGADGQL